ncbi:MAG: TonB family protein [Nitrospinota bacterium]|nr:MAG: TonB family protein [Nitrospinota bacterium]
MSSAPPARGESPSPRPETVKGERGQPGQSPPLPPSGTAGKAPSSRLPGGTGGSGDTLVPPVPRYNPPPSYPRKARRFGWEGTVLLIIEVRPDGRSGKITVKKSSGYPLLDRAAIRTVRKWRFTPARRQGTPVSATVELPVVFRLDRR